MFPNGIAPPNGSWEVSSSPSSTTSASVSMTSSSESSFSFSSLLFGAASSGFISFFGVSAFGSASFFAVALIFGGICHIPAGIPPFQSISGVIPASELISNPLWLIVSNAFCIQSAQISIPGGIVTILPALLSDLRHTKQIFSYSSPFDSFLFISLSSKFVLLISWSCQLVTVALHSLTIQAIIIRHFLSSRKQKHKEHR